MAVRIQDVEAGSPAALAGITPGMELISLDGHAINDGLDYEFYSPPAQLAVVCREEGAERRFTVRKEDYQPLGCLFESYLITRQHACRNKCEFCFIDQLPRGLRSSLYFKDDDERLGFLFGNYVTLTNLGEAEIQRIIDMRISPVNISVHTANPALRCEMMGNPRAGEVLSYIPRLAEAGIALNTQLVLVPGRNDGDELRRSIEWLSGFAPAMQSIAAVPVGLTRHREGLAGLHPYTPAEAVRQLDILLAAGEEQLAAGGPRLVYPSDEWFLLAGRPIPPATFYEDFPQLENGVGMWRLTEDDFLDALADAAPPKPGRSVDIATGLLAAPLLRSLAEAAQRRFPGLGVRVHAVENTFLGQHITVAGLLTGGDLRRALAGRLHSGRLLLTSAMLRAEGDCFLDDDTPEALGEALGATVEMVPAPGEALLGAMLGNH